MSATIPIRPGTDTLAQPYDPVAKMFHWLTVALLLAQYLTKYGLPGLLPASSHQGLGYWHISIGPTILLVVLLRLGWRLTHTPPPAPVDLPPWLRLLARSTQWTMYALLIVLPVLGWLAVSAHGGTAYLLGFIPLPSLVATDKAFAESVGQVHGTGALLLLAVIALHVSGASYHAFVKRDSVVGRMLPTPAAAR